MNSHFTGAADSDTFVGIDCGQSHLAISVITESGQIVGRGVGGPSHIQGASMEQTFRNALQEAMESMEANTSIEASSLKEASKSIGEDLSHKAAGHVLAVGVGATGIGIPGKREAISSVLADLFPGVPHFLTNDAVTAHWGATGGADGATVLAGTGTIAFGRYRDKETKLGGFGYLLGDEGGGIWIGLTALRKALQSSEGRGMHSSLCDVIPPFFGVENIRQVPGNIYASRNVDVRKISSITQLVAEEADHGDVLAHEVLTEAARELGSLACEILIQLGVLEEDAFPVYRLGGVWKAGLLINEPFELQVTNRFPNILWRTSLGDAAFGAAIYAQSRLR